MNRAGLRYFLLFILLAAASLGCSQTIRSSYVDLTVPGQWKAANFGDSPYGLEAFYDAATGSIVEISALPNMQRVADISKLFSQVGTSGNTAASEILSAAAFPLPRAYTQRVSLDLGKGSKPPRMWELKDGDGNPMWFYASQLFADYREHDVGLTSSEVVEQYYPAKVVLAGDRATSGGDALVLEAETEHTPVEAALKRFKMPPALKDQKLRYGWVQFAPGGIAAAQGVLSVSFAVPANSPLTADMLLQQLATAKFKPME